MNYLDILEKLEQIALTELRKERKIEAIRQVQMVSHWDLKTAKAFIDAVYSINIILPTSISIYNSEHLFFPVEYYQFVKELEIIHNTTTHKNTIIHGKLKPFKQVIQECNYYVHTHGSHYWTFYYDRNQEPIIKQGYGICTNPEYTIKLGFRDFYIPYFDTIVKVRPKYDRKKCVMRDRVQVYTKKDHYLMDAMKCWFEYFTEKNEGITDFPQNHIETVNLPELSWDELFEM